MTAKHLKGEYNLNPTSMVMKSGSEQAREAQRPGKEYVRGMNPTVKEAHQVSADTCTECDDMTHPAMQTRHSHPKNAKHADGRGHEDDHHAVRKMKGMM
jgi:hypothetical protein